MRRNASGLPAPSIRWSLTVSSNVGHGAWHECDSSGAGAEALRSENLVRVPEEMHEGRV